MEMRKVGGMIQARIKPLDGLGGGLRTHITRVNVLK